MELAATLSYLLLGQPGLAARPGSPQLMHPGILEQSKLRQNSFWALLGPLASVRRPKADSISSLLARTYRVCVKSRFGPRWRRVKLFLHICHHSTLASCQNPRWGHMQKVYQFRLHQAERKL